MKKKKLTQKELKKMNGVLKVEIENKSKTVKYIFGYPLFPKGKRVFMRSSWELAAIQQEGLVIYLIEQVDNKKKTVETPKASPGETKTHEKKEISVKETKDETAKKDDKKKQDKKSKTEKDEKKDSKQEKTGDKKNKK